MAGPRFPQLADAANNCRLRKKKTALRHVVLPWVAASTILIAPLFALG
jgi:hypothetical protein